MSPNVGTLMYQLRELNYEKAIKPTLRKLNDILPERTGKLIDSYSSLLVDPTSFENSLEDNSHKQDFLETMNSEDYKRCNETFSEIVHKGIEEYVKKEIDEVIKGES